MTWTCDKSYRQYHQKEACDIARRRLYIYLFKYVVRYSRPICRHCVDGSDRAQYQSIVVGTEIAHYAHATHIGEHCGSAVIKSHHNVGGLPSVVNFKEIVEPLRDLFKDEVRKVGFSLPIIFLFFSGSFTPCNFFKNLSDASASMTFIPISSLLDEPYGPRCSTSRGI